jgi:hypothetical protein
MKKRVPYGIAFGLHRPAVHTKCQIIYIYIYIYIGFIVQMLYINKYIGWQKKLCVVVRALWCGEVGSGVLTGYNVYCVAWGGDFCPALVEVDTVDCAALYYIYWRRPCNEMCKVRGDLFFMW